jgi:hypothetical protein
MMFFLINRPPGVPAIAALTIFPILPPVLAGDNMPFWWERLSSSYRTVTMPLKSGD